MNNLLTNEVKTLTAHSFLMLWFLLFMSFSHVSLAKTINGFNLSNSDVPIDTISHGGPPKDAIPSIDKPKFRTPTEAELSSSARVLAINYRGIQRAYPINILNWHEIVNDNINDQPFMVTYCPLCGSGIAFESEESGFGVSGLLYNSDVLLYDRATSSLWSQIGMRAISGKRKGETLKPIAVTHTTLSSWLKKFPDSDILSTETGFKRDYSTSPYAGYEKTPHLFFKVNKKAPDIFHPKSLVLGVRVDGGQKAYPYEVLAKNNQREIHDSINGKKVLIEWDAEAKSATVNTSLSDSTAHGTQLFWFAWYAFHPETQIYKD